MPERVTAKDLATVLHEPERWLLIRALRTLGEERCVAIVAETLTIESNGGMLTKAGDRRRTLGGTFLELCRQQATASERRAIFR